MGVCTSSGSSEPETVTETQPPPSHQFRETDTRVVHYVDHPERKETPLYRRTRHHLIHVLKLRCYICGDWSESKKPSTSLESHHFFCEYAEMFDMDFAKFANSAQTLYNPQTGEHLGSAFDWNEVIKDPSLFVDSPQNMMVLCHVHHVDRTFGIHFCPYPLWVRQKTAKDGVVVLSKT